MKKQYGALLILLPLLAGIAAFLLKRQSNTIVSRPTPQAVLAQWAGLHFEPIADTSSFFQKLSTINLIDHAGLQEREKDELFSTLRKLVRAYSVGTYEAYLEFRAPIAFTYNLKLAESRKRYFQQTTPRHVLPDDAEHIFRFTFNTFQPTNVWTGIDIANANLLVARTNSVPSIEIRHKSTAGYFKPNSAFVFDTSPAQQLQKDNSVTYAVFSAVLRHDGPDPAHEVDVLFFWDTAYSKWIPWEYVALYSGKRTRAILW